MGRTIPTVQANIAERTPEESRAFRDAVVLKAMGAITLGDLTEEEKCYLSVVPRMPNKATGYDRLLELRAAAYTAHVAAMTVPDTIVRFAEAMRRTYGPLAQVHQNRCGWVEALMVALYGEEPSVWPTDFDLDAQRRAVEWAVKGKAPLGIGPIPVTIG